MKDNTEIIIISVYAIFSVVAFIVGYNIGKSSVEIPDRAVASATTTSQSSVSEPYYKALGDPGKAIQYFDYDNQTRTTCYTISRTCRVEHLNIIK